MDASVRGLRADELEETLPGLFDLVTQQALQHAAPECAAVVEPHVEMAPGLGRLQLGP